MKYGIYWKTSSNYYPQGNGLDESTNKKLLRILKRKLENNPRTWHEKLNWALWVDRIIVKSAIKTSPYTLVYGKKATLPSHIELPILKVLQEYGKAFEPLQVQMNELLHLEELRNKLYQDLQKRNAIVKRWFDA